MSSIIRATTTSGLQVAPDNSGSLQLQTNGTTTAITIDTSQRAAFVAGTAALPAITTTGDTDTGIWFPAANTVSATTSGTERMRIASNGRVAIGTSTEDAASQLKVLNGLGGATGNPWEQSTLTLTGDAAMAQGVGPIISFEGNYLTGTGSGANFAWIKAAKTNGTSGSATGDLILGARGGNIRFSNDTTNSGLSTEEMRITDAGEVWIAGTTDRGAFNLQCNGTGVWGAGAYTNGSDERIKNNITPLDTGLDVVAKLNPVTYTYKEEWSRDQSIQTGFIAQDLLVALEGKNYVDGIVNQSSEYMSVAYQNIIPILTKAIQEMKVIIDEQSARIAVLEAK
jgi:hypothetical protein